MVQPTQYLPDYWSNHVPPGYQAVSAAEPAGGVVMPPPRAIAMVPQNQNNVADTALNIGGMGAEWLATGVKNAAMTGVAKVAAPVALTLSAVNANREAARDEKALIEQFRDEIAADQNIAREAVGAKELHAAAEHSPVLRERLDAMQQQTVANPLKMGVGIAAGVGVGLATGGLGFIPAALAGIAASSAASYGADALAKNAGVIPPEYTAKTNIDAMLQAREAGKDVTARDVFVLFAKADSELGKLVQDRAGAPAESASPEVIAEVMRNYHKNLNGSCEELASMINRGDMKPEVLAFIQPKQLTVESPEALQMLKAQAANNNNTPQNMISADGLVYGGKGVSYLAANNNRSTLGQFTGRVAAEAPTSPNQQSL